MKMHSVDGITEHTSHEIIRYKTLNLTTLVEYFGKVQLTTSPMICHINDYLSIEYSSLYFGLLNNSWTTDMTHMIPSMVS